MRPLLTTLLGFPVLAWHVFFVLAVFSACVVLILVRRLMLGSAEWSSLEVGRLPAFVRDPGIFFIFLSALYLCGLTGARAISLFQWLIFDERLPGEEGGVYGPMSFYGGLCGGAGGLAFWLLLGRRKWSWVDDGKLLVDMLALPLTAGLAVGRIGCLLNGDDYGRPLPSSLASAAPWWSFPSMGPGLLLRYPTQLQEAVFNLALLGIGMGLLINRRSRSWFLFNRGVLGAALIAFSALNRFFNEFFRGDPRGMFPGTEWPLPQVFAGSLFLCMTLVVVWSIRSSDSSVGSLH